MGVAALPVGANLTPEVLRSNLQIVEGSGQIKNEKSNKQKGKYNIRKYSAYKSKKKYR